jgi:undecaprenyl diphosphate synthase
MKIHPRHVAIIMDGNGRWASERNRPRSYGHLRGVESIRPIVECALEKSVAYLSLFAFSTENWRRDPLEVRYLFRLLRRYLRRELARLIEQKVRVRVIGDRTRLSIGLLKSIEEAEAATSGGEALNLVLAISYSGLDEMARVARSLAEKAVTQGLPWKEIDQGIVAAHLDAPDVPAVDLMIRTGNEQRISNFLLWRLAYAELLFTPTMWPEFTPAEFCRCLESFGDRGRRYGGAR